MKSIKRIIAVFLLIAMTLSFTACGFGEPSIEKLFGVKTDITIQQQEIYNENGITVTAKGLSDEVIKDGYFVKTAFYLQLEVTNTSGKRIYVSTNYFSVNDIMVSAWDIEYFDDGTTGELNIDLSPANLHRDGISVIKEMEFELLFGEPDAAEETFTLSSPITIVTSADEKDVQPADDSGITVYNGEEARIIIKEANDGDLRYFVENKLDQTINVESICVKINGQPHDGFEYNVHVRPGKVGFGYVAYPHNEVDYTKTNKFNIHFTIKDDTGKNMAFNQTIKDIGIVEVEQ